MEHTIGYGSMALLYTTLHICLYDGDDDDDDDNNNDE